MAAWKVVKFVTEAFFRSFPHQPGGGTKPLGNCAVPVDICCTVTFGFMPSKANTLAPGRGEDNKRWDKVFTRWIRRDLDLAQFAPLVHEWC